MTFNVGDKVHVEFDAAITAGPDYATGRLYTYTVEQSGGGAGTGAIHYVYLTSDNARVTKPAEPNNWPPQVGDIWEADGTEYFVYYGAIGLTVFPFSGNGSLGFSYAGDNIGDFKALNPTLVRRRPNDDWANRVTDYISNHYNSMSFR